MLKDRRNRQKCDRGFGDFRCFVIILILVFGGGGGLDELRGEVSGESGKKVFAHHMGSMNAGRGAMAWHTRHPELGNPEHSNGGDYRTLPLVPYEMVGLSLEESADLQIRRAMRIGIDGFAVNAWAGGDQAKEFLAALFKVAEENDYPFEISICPDPNTIEQPTGLTDAIADAVIYLLDRHGDSPKLARREGKPIIFGYQSVFLWVHYLEKLYDYDQELVDIARTTEEGWGLVGNAYANLESMVGQALYIQFDMGAFFHGVRAQDRPENGVVRAAAIIARDIPAVCEFLPSPYSGDLGQTVTAAGAEWGQPIYMNYDNPRTNWCHGGPGTEELRRRWREARESGATLLQLTTWNDYHENTNISPGTNNNYAYFDLTGYFIEWWKTGLQPEPSHDKMYVFSRKYPSGASHFPFQKVGETEGAIEILTILPEPARIRVPGRGEYDAPAGLFHQHFPVTPGPVRAELIRNGTVELVVESPEPITSRPFRQDNGITGISSECAGHWAADFGEAVPRELYSEYGDLDGNGLPNWFAMYWFGHFGDLSTAVGVDPDADVNGDGYTNREAYLLQRSPIESSVERAPFTGAALRIPGLIQAEYFDLGGAGVAYYDTTRINQGGQFRPDEQVDIEAAFDEEGGYSIGWMDTGEWLEYTVEVGASGLYEVRLRVASDVDGGMVSLFLDGEEIVGGVSIPNTGGWQEWETITLSDVPLQAGVGTLRVAVDSSWLNLNYIEFVDWRKPYFGLAHPLPGRVRAQHFDQGGQNVAYFDSTPFNEGGGYRTGEGVDLESTADVRGGYNVCWTQPGEWLLFTVNVTQPGIYDVHVRVATTSDACSLQIDFEGGEPIQFDLPNTGGWQNWETVTVSGVELSGGEQTMRLVCGSANFNINYIEAELASINPPESYYGGNSYVDWQRRYFTEEEVLCSTISGRGVDVNGDGYPNLMQYALNRHPWASTRYGQPKAGLISIGGKDYLTLTFPRLSGSEDLKYHVEVSSDLTNWKGGDEHVLPVSVTLNGESELVVMRDAQAKDEFFMRVIRLRIERVGP